MHDPEEPDAVGYGKPPKATQFRKGKSGNPNGRPKRTKNIDSLIERELDRVISVKEGGQEKRLRKREAIVMRLVANALKGDTRSIEYLVKYSRENGAGDPFLVNAEDEQAFKDALKRLSQEGDGAS